MTLEITETKAVIFYGDVYLINGLIMRPATTKPLDFTCDAPFITCNSYDRLPMRELTVTNIRRNGFFYRLNIWIMVFRFRKLKAIATNNFTSHEKHKGFTFPYICRAGGFTFHEVKCLSLLTSSGFFSSHLQSSDL